MALLEAAKWYPMAVRESENGNNSGIRQQVCPIIVPS